MKIACCYCQQSLLLSKHMNRNQAMNHLISQHQFQTTLLAAFANWCLLYLVMTMRPVFIIRKRLANGRLM